jgi:alcohol dehydrogenase
MQAIVYHGQGDKRWEDGPSPTIVDDTAAIGRVGPVPICGTDLHVLEDDVPSVTEGKILDPWSSSRVPPCGSADMMGRLREAPPGIVNTS